MTTAADIGTGPMVKYGEKPMRRKLNIEKQKKKKTFSEYAKEINYGKIHSY